MYYNLNFENIDMDPMSNDFRPSSTESGQDNYPPLQQHIQASEQEEARSANNGEEVSELIWTDC